MDKIKRRSVLIFTLLLIGGVLFAHNKEKVEASIDTGTVFPRVHTNQRFIEEMTGSNVDLEDIEGMFSNIFGALPDVVHVYPTENYYYFKIYTNGGEVWGNIRLDSLDREDGLLSFAYFFQNPNRTDRYYGEKKSWHKNFSRHDGVEIDKFSSLHYRVSYNGKKVQFLLNDIRQEFPEGFKRRPHEQLAARLYDEAGFQFILVFNEKLNRFYYILDESVPYADILRPFGKEVFLGQLSEFAFYDEPEMDRKILFSISQKNVITNNYYDGPFDQLADNFVDPERFQDMIERAYPYFKGKVKGRGDFVDKNGNRTGTRISISPYIQHGNIREVWYHVASCQKLHTEQELLSACIANSDRNYGKNT
jgi:hypothetical protein